MPMANNADKDGIGKTAVMTSDKEKISSKIGKFQLPPSGNEKYYAVITHYWIKLPAPCG